MPDRPSNTSRDGAPGDGVPAGTALVMAPGTRRLGPGLVAGGRPWRLLRLSTAGDRWIDRWSVGRPVPEQPGTRRLASRLVDTGLAWARPAPDPDAAVTVVVPCRDRAGGLAATLGALEAALEVVVVDDGSVSPAETARVVAARPGTRLVRRAHGGGPGAARNDGWRPVAAAESDDGDGTARDAVNRGRELIAFLDTDCIPPPGWVADLAGHFEDPTVGAVAPRIGVAATPDTPGWLQAYERLRSPLDLGPGPAPVRPRSSVAYVPSAALVVRLSALVETDGFDEDLTTGEDVDLVWRLDRAGWRVRYDPSVVVTHPVRARLRAWLGQRADYGRSAAPLASRHGAAVAPLAVSRTAATAWLLVGLGHPVGGLTVALASTARLAARPPRPPSAGRRPAAATTATATAATATGATATATGATATGRPGEPQPGVTGAWPHAEVARLALRSHVVAGLGVADAIRRAWWPFAVAAAVSCRRLRPALAAAVVVPPLVDWRRRPRRESAPGIGLPAWIILRLADDLAYGTGVWTGVAAERRARCLLPDLV